MRVLIFDIDGTLVKPDIDWSYVRRRLAEFGINVHQRPVAEILARMAIRNPRLAKSVEDEIVNIERQSAEKIKRDPELRDILLQFKSKGVKIAVVTLRGRETAAKVLESLGISDLVDVLVTREDSYDRKAQLKSVMKVLGAEPGQTYFLGDTMWDLEAGQAEGVNVLLIDSRKDPVSAVPKHLKATLRKLLENLP